MNATPRGDRLRALREANWLTARRAGAHARTAALLFALALAALWLTATQGVDVFGRPVGADFASFYGAGALAREGHAVQAYDWAALHAVERAMFGESTPLYIWTYPPFALAPMALLATLPYPWALALFLGVTFALFWWASRRFAPEGVATFWVCLGFPALWLNAAGGQNGFLSAAIAAAGLSLLPAHSFTAGAVFALLAFKPQLVLLVPVALCFGGRWRALAGLACGGLALLALSLMLYGSAPWFAQVEGMQASRQAILESGATGFHKLQSVLAAVRTLGGPSWLAWTLQAGAAAIALSVTAAAWRGGASDRLKGAALVCAALVATPFLNVYDLVLLGLPIAILASEGLRTGTPPWERLILLAAWIMPAVSVGLAEFLRLPVAPLVLLGMLWACHRRVRAASHRPPTPTRHPQEQGMAAR